MESSKVTRKLLNKIMDNLPEMQPEEEANILLEVDHFQELPEQKVDIVEKCLGKREKKEKKKKCDCC